MIEAREIQRELKSHKNHDIFIPGSVSYFIIFCIFLNYKSS